MPALGKFTTGGILILCSVLYHSDSGCQIVDMAGRRLWPRDLCSAASGRPQYQPGNGSQQDQIATAYGVKIDLSGCAPAT